MKPMLAATLTDPKQLRFPCMVSAKLDGVRAIIIDGKVMSRTLKPIPNRHVQELFGKPEFNGLDGELIVGPEGHPDVYRNTVSGVMKEDFMPDVQFFIFDNYTHPGRYSERFEDLVMHWGDKQFKKIVVLPHLTAQSLDDLDEIEAACLKAGMEGVMVRSLTGLYKHGRSTEKEGSLLKVKRFMDSEAIVVDMIEEQHNGNTGVTNELGRTARSSSMAGLVGKGTMGALLVRDLTTGISFAIGTGFTAADRKAMWESLSTKGKVAKYKYFPSGSKEKPRFPVFLGWRDSIDIGEAK